MKIAVIGANAMGCLYSAYLSRNNRVLLLDDHADRVRTIGEAGITLIDGEREEHYENIRVCGYGECRESMDLVMIFVRSTDTEAALARNHWLFGDSTMAMTVQCGVGNDRSIASYIRKDNIVIGITSQNAVEQGEGRCLLTGSGITTIGSNYGAELVLKKMDVLLTEAGFRTEVTDDIQRVIWGQLFVDLSINTFTAITRTPIGYMVKDENAWHFAKRLIYEAIDVAEEDGTYFDRRQVLENVRRVCLEAENGFSAMYQDVIHGLPTEIDAINGAIVEQAKLYGVSVPYNSLIVDLIHAMEGAYEYNS